MAPLSGALHGQLRAMLAMGHLAGVVQTVEGDASKKDEPGMPRAGEADLVTFSYSLTMIPDWRAAVDNVRGPATRALVPLSRARAA